MAECCIAAANGEALVGYADAAAAELTVGNPAMLAAPPATAASPAADICICMEAAAAALIDCPAAELQAAADPYMPVIPPKPAAAIPAADMADAL